MNHESILRLGVIASAGGSVVEALVEITRGLPLEWHIVTDRRCGIEDVAVRNQIAVERVEDKDNREFSRRAASILRAKDVDAVLLFFLRLVTPDIFGAFRTFNFHPSLLPAFSGFAAVRRAREAGVRILGATLHVANELPDEGPILAQAADPVDPNWPEPIWMHISFRQKVRLGVWLIDALLSEKISGARPSLPIVTTSQTGSLLSAELIHLPLVEAMKSWDARNPEIPPA